MGFSAEWLRLREPADHAARDMGLLRDALVLAGAAPVIVDLGSGTGSTLRAVAPRHRGPARWHLVDHDAALLAQAAAPDGAELHRHVRDLTALDTVPLEGATLVTASALLDLCSADWLAELARRIAAQRLPFYAALSYDGVMRWTPVDPADAEITAAFNAHQRGDKGFGAALGPDAAQAAGRIFTALGYVCAGADSPWHLRPDHAALQHAFLDGVAQAAADAGAHAAQAWLARRRAQIGQGSCHVGHRDLLAVPAELVTQAQGMS